MGFFEDTFDPAFMFDNEHKQRRDLVELQHAEIEVSSQVRQLNMQVEQLRLTVNTLVELMVHKNVATRDEIDVLLTQVDLLDGVEDGKIGPARSHAPRCRVCNHYVNPQRETCVYCGTGLADSTAGGGPYRGGPAPSKAAVRVATCSKCGRSAPQDETYFTEEGVLVCDPCYAG